MDRPSLSFFIAKGYISLKARSYIETRGIVVFEVMRMIKDKLEINLTYNLMNWKIWLLLNFLPYAW